MFLEYAKRVISVTDDALPEIRSGKVMKTLRIGCSNTIYECHLGRELLDTMADDTSYKITIGLSSDLNEKLQAGVFDVVYTFIPFRKKGFDCRLYHKDEMVLVTDYGNTAHKSMSRELLAGVDFVMCDFALSDVGSFIRNIFPEHHRFAVEIDDCSKVPPFLMGRSCYAFLPREVASPYIIDKKLREIKLNDIETPVIQSYVITRR